MAEQYVELLRATSSSSALAQGAERNRMMLAIKMTKAALLAVACLPSARPPTDAPVVLRWVCVARDKGSVVQSRVGGGGG